MAQRCVSAALTRASAPPLCRFLLSLVRCWGSRFFQRWFSGGQRQYLTFLFSFVQYNQVMQARCIGLLTGVLQLVTWQPQAGERCADKGQLLNSPRDGYVHQVVFLDFLLVALGERVGE